MKNHIILLVVFFLAISCSKEDNEEDSKNTNFGYYLGMPRYEYENVTGAYLIDNTLQPHWSDDVDKYSLPNYVYYESNEPDESGRYDSKGFYGEITFALPSDKLASAKLTFRHEGTEWSNESKGLRPEEAEEIIVYIGEYLNDLAIRAKLSIVQHNDEYYDADSDGWVEIVGYLDF